MQGFHCSVCSNTPVVWVCAHNGSLLCQNCRASHSGSDHTHHNIAHDSFQRILADLQCSMNFPAACEEARSSVQDVDRCIAELNEKVETTINTLKEIINTETEKLRTMKEEIQDSIEGAISVEESRRKRHKGALKAELRKMPRLKWVDLEVRVGDPASIVAVRDKTTLSSTLLHAISNNSLSTFDLQAMEDEITHIDAHFGCGTVFCQLTAEKLLAVGGFPAAAEAYLLNLSNGRTESVEPMSRKRIAPGIIEHNRRAYVFGGKGISESTTTCEKLETATMAWSQLPYMQFPRYYFSPCLFEDDIYLAEVYISKGRIETFNVISETFKTLSVSIPVVCQGKSVSFICNQELLVVAENGKIGTLLIKAEETFRVHCSNVEDSWNYWSNIAPLQFGGLVYWARWSDGIVVKFNPDRKEFLIA